MRFECSVCCETIKINQVDGVDICSIKCGHVFHQKCVKEWMQRSKTCPQCRTAAVVKDIQLLFFNTAHGDTSVSYHNESLSVALFEKDEMHVLKENLEEQSQEIKTIRDLNADLLKENDQMAAKIAILENRIKQLQIAAKPKNQQGPILNGNIKREPAISSMVLVDLSSEDED